MFLSCLFSKNLAVAADYTRGSDGADADFLRVKAPGEYKWA